MKSLIMLFLGSFLFSTSVFASNLTLMPISLDITAPKIQDHFTVHNNGEEAVRMQLRIFRWEKKNGKDYYTPTKDVIVSPPFTTVKPNTDTIIRIVRTSKAPIVGEETYRVFFDELPSAKLVPQGARLNILTRMVAPVFFSSGKLKKDMTTWRVRDAGSNFELIGTNAGERRLKVSDVLLLDGKTVVGKKTGLVEYILGGTNAVLQIPRAAKGTPTKLRLLGDFGALEEDVVVSK